MTWLQRLAVTYAIVVTSFMLFFLPPVMWVMEKGMHATSALLFVAGALLQRMGWWHALSFAFSVLLAGALNAVEGLSMNPVSWSYYSLAPLIGALVAAWLCRSPKPSRSATHSAQR